MKCTARRLARDHRIEQYDGAPVRQRERRERGQRRRGRKRRGARIERRLVRHHRYRADRSRSAQLVKQSVERASAIPSSRIGFLLQIGLIGLESAGRARPSKLRRRDRRR